MRKILHDNIDFLELQKEIYTILYETKNLPFAKRVEVALDTYLSVVLHTDNISYKGLTLPIGDIIVRTQHIATAIKHILDDFYNGRIQTCYRRMSSQMQHFACTHTITPGTIFYRMRTNQSDESFSANEMFHVPYSKIEYLGSSRYSISGYPCLYVCPRPETTWKELRMPNLHSCNLSCLKCKSPLKLLDLRWNKPLAIKEDGSPLENDLLQYIISFPFVISCSIPTASENHNFHIEYIIPQVFLHNLLLNSSLGDGVIYTSSRIICNFSENDEHREDCIVLPARRDVNSKEYSRYLSDRLSVTNAISITDIGIKYLDQASSILLSNQPVCSIFEIMEQLLNNFEFKTIQ